MISYLLEVQGENNLKNVVLSNRIAWQSKRLANKCIGITNLPRKHLKLCLFRKSGNKTCQYNCGKLLVSLFTYCRNLRNTPTSTEHYNTGRQSKARIL